MSIRILLTKTLLGAAVLCVLGSCSNRKTGYVDVFRLVNEFELQKEYTAEAKARMEQEKQRIDSVVAVERLRDPASSERMKNELYAGLMRTGESVNKEVEGMIWKRLNPYMVDYGKEHGYQYIYGANGTGNVLYADEGENITDELIKYVNDRYHDKKN